VDGAGGADPRGVRAKVRHLRVALPVAGVVAALGALAGGLTAGVAGALCAAAGVALVAASYTATTLAVAWADSVNPRMVFGVGIGMYVTKFSLFGGLLIALQGVVWAGRIPFAMGIVAGVVSWTATQIWWTVRTQHPYVGPADGGYGHIAPRPRSEPAEGAQDSPEPAGSVRNGPTRPGPSGRVSE
jgi:hypothetical protein